MFQDVALGKTFHRADLDGTTLSHGTSVASVAPVM